MWILDAVRLTHSYPYEEINGYIRSHPEYRESVARTVAYFDGVNFASMVRCPTLVYIGQRDDVCPPESSLALYRALTCEAQLLVSVGSAHDGGTRWVAADIRTLLGRHLRPGAERRGRAGQHAVRPDGFDDFWKGVDDELAGAQCATRLLLGLSQ